LTAHLKRQQGYPSGNISITQHPENPGKHSKALFDRKIPQGKAEAYGKCLNK
jgi:hypothetical protein